MAELKYRQTTAPTVPVSTVAKGSPLTNLEMDGNFKSIADDLNLKSTTVQLNAGIAAATDAAVAMAIALG